MSSGRSSPFFFFNDTATTEIYTLSLHDALPISNRSFFPSPIKRRLGGHDHTVSFRFPTPSIRCRKCNPPSKKAIRSEEHTSELQSHLNLVCRLLLEKKKQYIVN